MKCCNEDELLYLYRQGSVEARDYLFLWSKEYVEKVVLATTIPVYTGIDFSDLFQASWIACSKALDRYRLDLNCTLRTFLSTVIKNQIRTMIKKQSLEKKRYIDHGVSFDAMSAYGCNYDELIEDKKEVYNPTVQLVVNDINEIYCARIEKECSLLEKEVIAYRMQGYLQKEIAKKLGVDSKVVYNALYRLQKKLGNNKYN